MQEPLRSEAEEWVKAGRQAVVSGTLASVLSTAVLAIFGRSTLGKALAPTNATSHWLWGNQAYREHTASFRHTGVGYATHHASAMMWATIFERWLNYRNVLRTSEIVRDAAAMSAIASFVDYQLTPPRLRPGFEQHLSRGELLAVFAAFGVGLACGAVLNRQHDRRLQDVMTMPVRPLVH